MGMVNFTWVIDQEYYCLKNVPPELKPYKYDFVIFLWFH